MSGAAELQDAHLALRDVLGRVFLTPGPGPLGGGGRRESPFGSASDQPSSELPPPGEGIAWLGAVLPPPLPHPLASAPHSPDYMSLVIIYLFS